MAGAKYKRDRSAVKNQKPGYNTKAYVAYLSDFLSLAAPVAPFALPEDKFKITADHTFTAPAGFAEVYALPNTLNTNSDTTGEPGANTAIHKLTLFVPGDDAKTLAFMEELQNQECIVLLTEVNEDLGHIQYGDKLVPCVATGAPKFTSGTQFGDKKGYELEMQTTGKYYYSGTVTLLA